jgi:hypothetical protein
MISCSASRLRFQMNLYLISPDSVRGFRVCQWVSQKTTCLVESTSRYWYAMMYRYIMIPVRTTVTVPLKFRVSYCRLILVPCCTGTYWYSMYRFAQSCPGVQPEDSCLTQWDYQCIIRIIGWSWPPSSSAAVTSHSCRTVTVTVRQPTWIERGPFNWHVPVKTRVKAAQSAAWLGGSAQDCGPGDRDRHGHW